MCGTGRTPSLQFFSRDQLVEFGSPHARSDESATEQYTWADLEAAADEEGIFITFDLLGYADRLLKQLGLDSHRRGGSNTGFHIASRVILKVSKLSI